VLSKLEKRGKKKREDKHTHGQTIRKKRKNGGDQLRITKKENGDSFNEERFKKGKKLGKGHIEPLVSVGKRGEGSRLILRGKKNGTPAPLRYEPKEGIVGRSKRLRVGISKTKEKEKENIPADHRKKEALQLAKRKSAKEKKEIHKFRAAHDEKGILRNGLKKAAHLLKKGKGKSRDKIRFPCY